MIISVDVIMDVLENWLDIYVLALVSIMLMMSQYKNKKQLNIIYKI
jgi:hypothetical protein